MPRSLQTLFVIACYLLTGSASLAADEEKAPADQKDGNDLEHLDLDLGNDVTMKLVKIPAGKFLMGTDPAHRVRMTDDREKPQREVTISRDFFMGIHEVTRGQFAAFVKATGYLTQAEREGWAFAWKRNSWDKVDGASWNNTGLEQTDEHPVICASFDDAIAFCLWLNKKTGRNVLLPTEAQWEYAARAGTSTLFPWGAAWEDGKGWANASDETARQKFRGWRSFSWADGHVFTSPAGTYRANDFGLHDMTGNVWEWTADWYDKNYYKNAPDVDPPGPPTGSQRVTRGGSWMSSPPRCRSAARLPCDLRGSYCDAIIGFRIVIESDSGRRLPPSSTANRADWPDWRGPARDGISQHVPTGLPQKAKFLWTMKTTGPGHSGVAVADGRVLFADKSADERNDIWRCLDADTGKELWTLKYAAEGDMDYSNSPRATPVIHDGMAYLLGAFGHFNCVNPETGQIIWKKHLIKDFDSALPAWGMTATPLVVDDKLIVNPGAKEASIVALDRKTGDVIWKSPGGGAAYAAPILNNFQGQRQVITYDSDSLGGWDASTGKRVWRIVPDNEGDFNVPTPIAIGEKLLVATENNSTRLYGFSGKGYRGPVRIQEKAQRRFDDLAPDMITPVAYNGMVFGAHNSYLYCLDAKSLQLLWKQKDMAFYAYTSLIAGNGHVMIVTIDGELLLVRADRKEYKPAGRLRVFDDDKTEVWSHPALVEDNLYIRNQNSINCLSLR
jgi:formylglycine-generating enzyme required for sulfatase activity